MHIDNGNRRRVQRPSGFRRLANALTTAFVACSAAIVGVAAGAEESSTDAEEQIAADEQIEVVIVTGIRGSMQQSLERKRLADHFVDAITAEDIGAFPDQNLAESLQRISGVAIDRKEGEGAFVSVRGLGPQFVQTTIGGRVSASNVAPGAHDGRGATNTKSRAVGFHAFQSGLVQAVEVHKSPRADHIEGGLGGFVDIQPRKPFDLGERQVALSLDATRNELADDLAPGVFALFSDVLSETVGFMVSAQWDNRVFRSDQLHQWSHVGPRTVTVDGRTMTGYLPQQFLYELHLTDRDRLNVSSALQWQPSDRVDVTFDVLHTDNSTVEQDFWRDYRLQQGTGRATAAAVENDNGTGIFTMMTTTAGAFMQHAKEEVENESSTYGVNLEFQATDNLLLNFDATVSTTQAPIIGGNALMRNTRAQMTYHKYGPGGGPSVTSTSPLLIPDFWEVQKMSLASHVVDDQVTQFRGDATYEFYGENWLDSIQVGARIYRGERRVRYRYLNSVAFRGEPITNFGGSGPFPAEGDFLTGLGLRYPGPSLNPNYDGFQGAFSTRADEIRAHRGGFNTGPEKTVAAFTQGDYGEDLNHEDDGNAVYAMVTFSGELGSTPYSGNFGVRYVDNQTSTAGEIVEPVSIDLSDPGVPLVVVSPPRSVDVGNDYTETLPSLNLRFDPTDDVVVRVSAAKVLSRPAYRELNPQQSVQARPRTMRAGNPDLKPTIAVQFDLALEWYFADYSIASIGLFTKDIEAFVQSEITPTPWEGITDPETNLPLVLTAFRPLNTGKSDMTGIELSF